MTAPNQFTSGEMQVLQSYIAGAQYAFSTGNYSGGPGTGSVQDYMTRYYQFQANLGRGYAKLALQVDADQGYDGKVALDMLSTIGTTNGAAVTPQATANLMLLLGESDLGFMSSNGGIWPQMKDIEDYHYLDFPLADFLPWAWGGADMAYFGMNWGGGTLTSYEVGDGSHSSLYQSLSMGQVLSNYASIGRNGLLEETLASANILASIAQSADIALLNPTLAIQLLEAGAAKNIPA